MSLSIDARKITAVYALGEWHKVKEGTFEIDAYELMNAFDDKDRFVTFYELGSVYDERPRFEMSPPIPGSLGEHWRFRNVQGFHGCRWIDPVNCGHVSVSLMEIKGWKVGGPQ